MRKRKNGECNFKHFRLVFFGVSSDIPAFKVPIFASDILNFELDPSKLISVVDIPTQILLTILLSIDNSSRGKLKVCTHTKENPSTIKYDISRKIGKPIKVKRMSKIWVRISTTKIFTPIQNLKSLVKTRAKEKLS